LKIGDLPEDLKYSRDGKYLILLYSKMRKVANYDLQSDHEDDSVKEEGKDQDEEFDEMYGGGDVEDF
jgi:hypothetical protein